VVGAVVFAVPGDLATPTGGYVYDRRIIQELTTLGWKIDVTDLGDGFPHPSRATRVAAERKLAALAYRSLVVVDGLAFGVLPDIAEKLRTRLRLVALVHHPLALEAGLPTGQAAVLRTSERDALSCATHVIVTSATTAGLLTAEFEVPPGRVSVIEPGTDRVQQTPRNPESFVRLLSVGAVVPRKGYDVLVAALARLRTLPWRLTIVGDCGRDPATAQSLNAQMRASGLSEQIQLLGAVRSEEMSSFYANCDVFVSPSRYEGYGMAFSEALAHGLPVIGTRAGALAQTIPPDAGLFVPVDDVESLAAALRELIENSSRRERLALAARAARFPSWREQAVRFARVLEQL
jgi:glycosyltransferase involved in cell wall biosynthesis